MSSCRKDLSFIHAHLFAHSYILSSFMKSVFGAGVVYDCDPKKRNLQMQRTSSALKSTRLRSYVEKIKMVGYDW